MQKAKIWILGLALFILTPPLALAQFEALQFVELPAIGSWAKYQVTSGAGSKVTVLEQKIAFLTSQQLGTDEYFWFQLESESDDYGPKRVPVVMQFALSKQDAQSGEDYFRKLRELIVQVGDAPAVRIAPDFLQVGIEKNLLPGGKRGAGSQVDFTFRELDEQEIVTDAGKFGCQHKKGLGKAEVIMDLENPERYEVDVIREVWFADDVPFGLVRQVSQHSGIGPQSQTTSVTLDSEQTIELIAYGAGAESAIRGQVFEYNPRSATQHLPVQ